jgi:hypothetical protein
MVFVPPILDPDMQAVRAPVPICQIDRKYRQRTQRTVGEEGLDFPEKNAYNKNKAGKPVSVCFTGRNMQKT